MGGNAAHLREPGHERIVGAAAVGGLNRVGSGDEIRRGGLARGEDIPGGVHGDAGGSIVAAAAQVRGIAVSVDAGGADDLRHEGITGPPSEDRLRRAPGGWEVRRRRIPCQVDVAAAHCYAVGVAGGAHVGREAQRIGARGGAAALSDELGHEGARPAPERGLNRLVRGEVRRRGPAGDVDVPEAIDRDSPAPVGAGAAQVSGIAVGVHPAGADDLRDEDVRASDRGLVCTERRGEVERIGEARYVGVPRGVHGEGVALVPADAAQVGDVARRRVDDQGQALIVRAQLEADAISAQKPVSAGHRPAFAVRVLVDQRRVLNPIAGRQAEDQRAVRPQLWRRQVRVLPRNARRVGARRDDELTLQAAVGPTIDEVDAGIEVAVGDGAVSRDADAPARRIIPEEETGCARQRPQPLDDGVRVRRYKVDPRQGVPRGKDHPIFGEEQRMAGAASDELHGRIGLTGVRGEAHRQPSQHRRGCAGCWVRGGETRCQGSGRQRSRGRRIVHRRSGCDGSRPPQSHS